MIDFDDRYDFRDALRLARRAPPGDTGITENAHYCVHSVKSVLL